MFILDETSVKIDSPTKMVLVQCLKLRLNGLKASKLKTDGTIVFLVKRYRNPVGLTVPP
jgi:hypothetical protein